MKPIRLDVMDKVFVGPEGTDIAPLPVLVQDNTITSAWEPEAEERHAVAEGRPILLTVWGEMQPPVFISVAEAYRCPNFPGDSQPRGYALRSSGGFVASLYPTKLCQDVYEALRFSRVKDADNAKPSNKYFVVGVP